MEKEEVLSVEKIVEKIKGFLSNEYYVDYYTGLGP